MRVMTRSGVVVGATVAAASMLALTGCLNLDADLQVASDGLVSGELTLEISQQAAGFLGITSSEALLEQLESGQIEGAQATTNLNCEAVERTGALAVTCSFSDQEFSEPGELWWVSTDAESVTFHSTSGDAVDAQDTEIFGDLFTFGGYTMDVTMPGKITSVTGDLVEQTSDNSVRIDASLTDTFDIAVVSEKGSGGTVPVWLWVVLGVIVGAAAVGAFTLISRRKKASPAQPIPPQLDGSTDPQPPTS